ncbi:MAG: hypothetical protein Q8M02_13315 [Candidatus Didemnitutus sp.]|nr:hypothetical protein [Candidatus Didemnitutus sp.]
MEDHLARAEFALKVVSHTACIQGTPALDNVHSALDQVARARGWVARELAVETPKMKPKVLPQGKGLPLTRQQRLGFRWE